MNDSAAAPSSSTPPHSAPVVLIAGISGSGKTVALNALEDAGYFCVDNLPPELLREFLNLERIKGTPLIAIAADVRSALSMPILLAMIDNLRHSGVRLLPIFLDARTEALVPRFSETRRRHPLSSQGLHDDAMHTRLIEAIHHEREMLAGLHEISTVIDTSDLRPVQLRAWIRQLAGAAQDSLTLTFESFAFKRGVPRDADMVFDLRMLPNPHYVPELRAQTGRDPAVIRFLEAESEVADMLEHIETFLTHWLPSFARDQRCYLTVAVGCTGGQHRSVYCAEQLAQRFKSRIPTLVRHRELETRAAAAG